MDLTALAPPTKPWGKRVPNGVVSYLMRCLLNTDREQTGGGADDPTGGERDAPSPGALEMEIYPLIFAGSLLILPREPVSDGVLEYTIHLAPFEIGVLEWDQSSGQHADRRVILCQKDAPNVSQQYALGTNISPSQHFGEVQTSGSPSSQG